MTLTKDVLVKLIKEELEAIMAEQGEELEEVDPVDAEIASLEQQLAEAKQKKMQKGKLSGKRAAGGMKMKGATANVYDKNFGKKGVKKSSK
jgi:DNA primase large subunit